MSTSFFTIFFFFFFFSSPGIEKKKGGKTQKKNFFHYAPHGVLPALARVRLAADPVHRHRDRLVRLPRDRAQRHPARAEARHDIGGGLDLVDRDGVLAGGGDELEAVAEDRGGRVGKVLHVGVVGGLRGGALASEALKIEWSCCLGKREGVERKGRERKKVSFVVFCCSLD